MTDKVRASHILLMYAGSARSTATRSKEEAEQKIGEIISMIDEGGDFAEIAQAESDCPSGKEGGDLGFFERGMMVPEFEAACFELSVGDHSPAVETPFGYHVILRTA